MRRWALLVLSITLWFTFVPPARAQGGDGQTTIHVVQRGETLFRIAQMYGTSVEAISQTNSLQDATNIQTGQRLIIPSSIVNAAIRTADRHVVQPGESLAHIALRHGSTSALIAALNNIVNPDLIYVGQVLDVSQTAPGHPSITRGYTHTVRADETLYRIAMRYGSTLDALMLANDLTSPNVIFPGQRLLIPGSEGAPALQVVPSPMTELSISPLPPEVGRTISITVRTGQAVTIAGSFLDRPLHFFSDDGGLTSKALYGIHAFTVPGLYPLNLTVQDSTGTTIPYTATVRISDGGYNSETITLPPDQSDLLDPAVNRDEYAQIASLVSGLTPERYFDGKIGLPAAAPVTSQFGTRRSYNGSPYDRFHTGTDFGGIPGSNIYAPAAGKVVFVGTLDIHGLTTIIDHGWGVFTNYNHQQETFVQTGQTVSAGEALGTIGNSGRSIGPHLHWELWVSGVEVDPLQWARTSFP